MQLLKYLGQVKNSSGQVDFYWPLVLDKWLRKKFDHPWLSIGTHRSNQSVPTQKEKSIQVLHCLSFHQHLLDA